MSKVIDVAELSQTDHQNIYLIYVQDSNGMNVAAKQAYGIGHRTQVIKNLLAEYGHFGIEKIEHEE